MGSTLCKEDWIENNAWSLLFNHFQVKFIAINCWTGTCKETHVLDSFPKIFAYHSGFNGVQYVGDYDARQMVSHHPGWCTANFCVYLAVCQIMEAMHQHMQKGGLGSTWLKLHMRQTVTEGMQVLWKERAHHLRTTSYFAESFLWTRWWRCFWNVSFISLC